MTITLRDIYENLGPSSISNSSNTISKDIFELLADSLYDPTGKPLTFTEIKEAVQNHFSKAADDQKSLVAHHFHGLGGGGEIDVYTTDEDNYWKSLTEQKNMLEIIGIGLDDEHKNSLPAISVFPIRGPRITPSKRGTQKISFFLNYTPSIVVAQMVPFLDVKFIIARTQKNNISTPGIIRFLLGSGPIDGMAAADKLMVLGDYSETANTGSSGFGMEMFLMPQTLTNMEALKPSSAGITRLTNVKPFVPFASIEGFDVSIQNAGAGAFAHKKGTLKLKIHDKSRLSEISEFIKGSDGFSRASISTTYGWSAPKNRGVEDEYSSFINDNMQVTDKWTVSNSQFSFDASGQVAINLELVSKSAMVLQGITMVGAETGVEKFYNAIKLIEAGKSRITGRKNYSADALTEKIFNATSGDGHLSGMSPDQIAIASEKLIRAAERTFDDADEKEAFKLAVKLVTSGKKGKWDDINSQITGLVNKKFEMIANGADPFLPSANAKKYFEGQLIACAKIVNEVSKRAAKAAKKPEKTPSQKNNKDNDLTASGIVSFGKVFLTLVAPQIDKSTCDELQIFFYGLNDECGWSSGFSTAEFPIEMHRLAEAYKEKIKTIGTTNIPIETMLSIIADSHFSEPSALGYGMSDFYDIDPKDKKKIIETKDTKKLSQMAQFVKDFGDLRLPMIEMFTETVSRIIENREVVIKRIHIYDKLNSPYGFEQQVLDSKEGYIIATVSKNAERNLRNATLSTYTDLKKQSEDDLEKLKNSLKEKIKNSSDTVAATMAIVKPTAGVDFLDASTRGAIKSYLTTKLPTLTPGTNGSLILSISAASKTDNTQGSINLINSMNPKNKKLAGADDGLSDAKNLPLRSVPMQVTMSTLGVPTAALYQKYFIDFNTGTTIDNIYNCNQIQHSISQGKFTTNWTFIYDNGYARFISPASSTALITGGVIEAIAAEQSNRDASKAKTESEKAAAEAEANSK